MARYSASVEDRETTDCLFVFQGIGATHKRIKYPVLERLSESTTKQVNIKICDQVQIIIF